MAQSCADLLREKFGEGPMILGGYCGGAILAMDAAKHLADAGCDIRYLIILDAAPFNTEFESNDALSRAGQRARQVVGKLFKDPSLETIGEIAQKTKTIVMRQIKNAFSHKAAYAQMSAEDIVPNFDEFHKADQKYMRNLWEAILAYRPPMLSRIPTTVYLVDDPAGRDLEAIWRGINPNADIRIFPGSHATMHMEPSLGEAIQALLAGRISPLPRVGKTASPGPLTKLAKRFT
jgi:thioesterase domain-containing protein